MGNVTYARTLLDNVVDVISLKEDIEGALKGQALTDVNKGAVVAPSCIYTRDLTGFEYIDTLQSVALDLFTSYYLMAVDVVARVDSVVINRVLGDVNPDVGLENYNTPLDMLSELPMPSMEARYRPSKQRRSNKVNKHGKGRSRGAQTLTRAKGKVSKDYNKDNITALGKMVTVGIEVKRGKKVEKIEVETLIKIINVPMAAGVLAPRLALGRKDHDADERWEAYKLGKISFWNQLVWNDDIIKEEERISRHPDATVLNKIKERHRAGMLRAVRGKGKAYGVGSNIVITTTETIRQVELMSKQYIDRGDFLQNMFESMGFMILMVVDKEEEMVSIHIKGISKGSVHTLKSLKKKSGKDDLNIMSMLRDLQQANTPII